MSKSSQKETSLDSLKKYTKRNDTKDYESVIKQFDDLILELSESKKCVNYPQNLSSAGEGSIINEPIKDKTGYYEKQLTHLIQYETTLKSFVKESKTSDKKTGPFTTAEQSKLTDSPSSHYKDSSFPEGEENVLWINSHLWDLGNKRDASHLLKPQYKPEENIPVDFAAVSLTGNDISLPMYVTKMAEKANVPCFSYYSKQVQDKKTPDCKKVEKFNSKTFSHAESHFREKSLYDHKVQASKTFVASSLLRSPKASRSPTSKYVLSSNCFLVKLYIETKDLHLGPFSFEIYPKMSLRLLKLKVEQEHGIKSSLQRWILCKCFAVDNEKSLAAYNVLPGSSIIVYVDYKQKIFSDDKQNEINSGQSSSKMNKETVNADKKEDGKTFDDSTSTLKCVKGREWTRKDRFDSKLPHSYSESDAVCERNFSHHKYDNDNDNLDIPAKNYSIKTDKICSPVAKKKLLKTSVNSKTKIKISEYEKPGLSSKFDEQFSINAPNTFENYHGDSVSFEKKSSPENKSSNLSDLEYLNRTIDEFEPMFMNHFENASVTNSTNNSKTNNSSVNQSNSSFESFNRVQSIEKNNVICSNAVSSSSTGVIDNEFRDNVMTSIRCNSKYSEFETEKEKGSLKESNNLMNSDNVFCLRTEKLESAYNHMDWKEESFFKNENSGERNNVNKCSSKNACLVKGLVNTESIEETLTSNGMYELINKSNDINKFDIHSSGLQSEASLQQNTPEKSGNDKNLPETSNNKIKCKQSVTSLIRKLSLTRKGKSLDEEVCSQKNSFTEIPCDEIKDDKETSDINNSILGDVHIEILSQDPNTILPENNTELYTHEKMQVQEGVSLVDNMESVKNFELLLEIGNMDLVENTSNFTCPVCFDEFGEGRGVILHDCLHIFCRDCLSNSVYHADSALVKCPYRDDFYSCESHLQQREIKALVSEEVYEKYLQRSIITAEGLEEKSFHCKTPDCRGWCIYDNAINVFHCPVCSHCNCLNCQAIHEGLNCRQYQDKLKIQQKLDKESEKTLELLNQMIQSGKALQCPKCDVILLKKWGCDWLKCSVCKTEICWITKGPRWGPNGQGDTSGGCRCGVNGVKCHPSCTYCH